VCGCIQGKFKFGPIASAACKDPSDSKQPGSTNSLPLIAGEGLEGPGIFICCAMHVAASTEANLGSLPRLLARQDLFILPSQ
jgi:hypothetical protein